ncbi:hypothetical protein CAEBREN_02040 [Caenorhabditis brenneri]|uniref:Uncharacterized protein n=1 Tax=Caenorhabditis brenneri TaxID=135651 RepID=G0NJ98_CAEBE|nr:hypothetical protein CAEBREN_02040 [Caenorhabditis brenneri]
MNSFLVLIFVASALLAVTNANIVEFEQLGYGGSGFKPQFEVSPIQARTGVNFEQYRNMQKDYVSSPMFQQAIRTGNQVLEKRPQSPWPLRNCYLSPVQCLLPVQQHQFNKFHKRFML